VLLKIRNAKYRGMVAEEERDDDLSGVPDVYEEDDPAYHLRVAAVYERKAAEHRRIAEEMESARLAEVAGGAGDEDDRPA
jgi:NhaA family Na+:H+ antiporter